MRLLLLSIGCSLFVLVAGCAAPETTEEEGSTSNAISAPARPGEDGRDGYLELQHVSTSAAVDLDHQFVFVTKNPDGSPKASVRAGEWLTAIIPSEVASELGLGGSLLGDISLFYLTNDRETNRDSRHMTKQADGSYAATSFTVPGDATAGPDELSPRLSMITSAKIPGQQIPIVSRAWSRTVPILRATTDE